MAQAPDSPSPSGAAVATLIAPTVTSSGRFLPALPHTTGPYWTGVADYEWSGAQFDSAIVADKPAEDGILVRFFYPAALKTKGALRGPSVPWLPSWRYGVAYGDFLKLPSFASYLAMTVLRVFSIPDAHMDVPLVSDHGRRLPVMIFTHGLGGMRTTYSSTCNELASYGWFVASLEHRDGSACLAMRDNSKNQLPLRTPPEGADLFRFRNSQVEHRAKECVRAVELLRLLDQGSAPPNAMTSQFNAAGMRDRLDFSRLSIAGHSFGVATALTACARYPQVGFRCALLQDGWMFPVDEASLLPEAPAMPPMVFVNSHTFQWTANVASMRKWLERDTTHRSLIMTIRDTAHQNASDFPLLLSALLQRFGMAGPLDPLVAQGLHRRVLLAFLHAIIPEQEAVPDWYHDDAVYAQDKAVRAAEIILDSDEGGIPVDLGKWT